MRKSLVSAGLTGLLAMASCEGPNGSRLGINPDGSSVDLGGVVSGGLTALGYARDNPGAIGIGEAGLRMAAARGGRDNISQEVDIQDTNNNSYSPATAYISQHPLRKSDDLLFTCSRYQDLNGNGTPDYPQDFDNINNLFDWGSPVVAVMSLAIDRPYNLDFKMFKDGELVAKSNKNFESTNGLRRDHIGAIPKEALRESGKYNIIFSIDGQFWGKTDFEVGSRIGNITVTYK